MNITQRLYEAFSHIDRLEISGMKCSSTDIELAMVYKGNSKYHFTLMMVQEVLRHINNDGEEKYHLMDIEVIPMDVRNIKTYLDCWITPDLFLKVELVKEADEKPQTTESGKQTKKQKVLAKTNGHCAYCGTPLTEETMTIDHIVPKVQGGTKALTNCYAACKRCNSLKSNKSLKHFRPLLSKELGFEKDFKFYFEK